MLDFKPYLSAEDNFTHTYSQVILIVVLMTGAIMTSRDMFKSSPKEPERQAIPIMIVYSILVIIVGFATTFVNLIHLGIKIYKMV